MIRKIISTLLAFLISFFLTVLSSLSFANEYHIKHDQRPTDLEYALMSKYAYNNDEAEGINLQAGQKLDDFGLIDWEVYKIVTGTEEAQTEGYYYLKGCRGIVFKNDQTNQLVLAYIKELLINMTI